MPEEASVSDIDIYINDKTRFLNVINTIYDHYSRTPLTTTNPIDYSGQWIAQNKISIVNLIFDQQRVNLQFILQEFNSAQDILKYYDYVQCALDCNRLIISRDCHVSHYQRRIIKGYHLSNATRLRTSTLKGFKAPIFGKVKNVQTTPLEFRLIEDDLEYFKPTMPLGEHNINDALIVAFEKQSTPIQLPNNGHNWINVYPVYGQISLKNQIIKSMYFSLEINVKQFISFSTYAPESEVKITPLILGRYIIKYCKIKNNFIDLLSGKQTVIARLRYSDYYDRSKMILKIVDLAPPNYDKILPCRNSVPCNPLT